MGDGYYNHKRNISKYSTISKTLSQQLKILLRRLRIDYNCHCHNRFKDNLKDNWNRKNIYCFELFNNIKIGQFDIKSNRNTQNLYYNNFLLKQIKSITLN